MRVCADCRKELAAGVGNVALRVNIKNGRHGEEFDPLERVCLRALEQRGISFSPLAQLPAILMLEHDLMDVRCGNPRVLPLMAEPGFALGGPKPRQSSPSSSPTANLRAQESPDSPRATGDPPSAPTSPSLGLPEPNRNPAYTNRAPVGTPLRGSTFRMPDLELIRCMMLMSEVHLYTGSRNILWQEAEADKKAASRPASRYGANGDSGEPYAHPWSDEAAFHRTIDRWVADITNRAAVRGLLKKTLGWDSNAAQARAKETDKPSNADASNGPSPPTASSAGDPWSSSYSRSSAKQVALSTSQRPQSLNSAQSAENAAQLHKMHRERRNSHKIPSSRPTSPRFSDYGDRTAESKSSAHRQRESLPPTPRIPKIPLLGVKRTTGFTAIRKPTEAAS
ncbi:hypothetical protein IE81DRAFT_108060 [Ceraceosorus guamensis]|uniref:Uncharacterized protein n=1 Tax=Ceraceosorus guamensis TaxID=1522189 RepID=A0A316VZT7_9BASI|nr:hypothetical protein IE81DRAFT_108060 [Ceraceosorus guamensis]PWN42992.1 hypothetical protein IE81DRAFT_108060 [Ceraceosorus guamensis]